MKPVDPAPTSTENPPSRTTDDPNPTISHIPMEPSDASRTQNLSERFVLGPEIARGGMGVVHRARDMSLGREVAIKLVQPWVMDHPHLVARFLAEASITAQLPHPGIPPVYEICQAADGRPQLAMKLIEGRTLQELLSQRQGTLDDLPRWLNIFEQVCLAVGYAHSRGVIHRDLKPSNIMVGAFGEVQVMDWGLAKAVGSSDLDSGLAPTVIRPQGLLSADSTQLGDMVGTPAYMPPEQARGLIADIDHRADVFGLGAILCTILTGRPPYIGENREVVIALARDGAIDDARRRLQACQIEPELLAIALQCLSPQPDDRPHDAGAVATAVAQLRESSQQRARQAEIASAQAQVQVAEARKRQRIQLALALTICALALLFGAGIWWRQSEMTRRASEKQQRELEDLQRLERNRASAELAWDRADELRRRELWQESLIALRQAGKLLADDPDPALKERVASLRKEVELLDTCDEIDTRHQARVAASIVKKVTPKLTTLDIVNNFAEAVALNNQRHEEMVAAFQTYGWDIYGGNHQTLAAEIKSTHCFPQFVANLDKMAIFDPHPLRRAQLLGFIDLLTGESWRSEFAVAWFLPSRLQALVRKIPRERRSPAFYNSVASRLATIDRPAAIAMLRDAVSQYPDNDLLLPLLAKTLANAEPPLTDEAIGTFRASLATNSNQPMSWMMLGMLELDRKEYRNAQAAYLRLVEMRPHVSVFWNCLGVAFYYQGDYVSAIEPMRRATLVDAQNSYTHSALAMVLREAGDPIGAIEAFEKAIQLAPTEVIYRPELAETYESVDKLDLAARTYREAIVVAPTDNTLRKKYIALLSRANRLEEREQQLVELREYDPQDHEATELLAESFAQRGEGKRAIELYEILVKRPELLEKHQRRLIQLTRQYAPQAVVDAVRAAIGRKINNSMFWHELAHELRQSGQAPAAVLAMRRAMELATPDSFAHVNLVLTMIEANDVAGANEYALRQKQLIPPPECARSCMAAVLAAQGKLNEAASEYEASLQESPGFLGAYNDYGIVLRQLGRSAEAVGVYEKLLAANPNYQFALGNYGRVLRDVGKLTESREALQKAVKLGELPWIQHELNITNRWIGWQAELSKWRSGDAFAPLEVDDALGAIEFCAQPFQREHFAAYRIYETSLVGDPHWEHTLRWRAISNAWPALSQDRSAEGPSDEQLLEMSRQVHKWLEAELAAITSQLASSDDVARREAEKRRDTLRHGKVFASLREPSELKRLPPEEITKWEALARQLP